MTLSDYCAAIFERHAGLVTRQTFNQLMAIGSWAARGTKAAERVAAYKLRACDCAACQANRMGPSPSGAVH